MNRDIENKIEEVIDQKMNNNEMFTAYDVSLDIQKNHGIKERHNNMKHYIHDVMNEHLDNYMPYKKSVVTINGKGSAFLYCHMNSDPNTYTPVVVAVPQPTGAIASAPAQTSTAVVSSNHAKKTSTVKTNSRDRLIIPKSSLESIGLVPKGIAVVYADPNLDAIIISSKKVTPDSSWTLLNKYIVDKSGNIMISENVMKKADITSGDSYYVDSNGDCITLTVEG